MARRTKLTAAMQEAIVTAHRAGATQATVCRYVGIDDETYRRWMRTNAAFRGAVERARGEWEVGMVATVTRQARAGRRDPLDALGRHPWTRAEWGPGAQRVTVEGGGEPVHIEVEHRGKPVYVDTREQLAELAATLDVMVKVGLIDPPPPAIGPPLVPRLVNPQPYREEPT